VSVTPQRTALTAAVLFTLSAMLGLVRPTRGPATADAGAGTPVEQVPALPVLHGTTLPPTVGAKAAVVMDAATGIVLYDKHGTQPLAPASLTKIMTALVSLYHLDPRRRVTVDLQPGDLDPDSSIMGLDPGEEVSVEDLLYGLMLPSGNDAAVMLARTAAGTEAAFVKEMNQTAMQLGLHRTRFVNSHGLEDPAQRTTALDMAQLARQAMRDARFRRIVAADSWTVRSQWTYVVRNKNPFLGAYPGADGVKIGWTEEAGPTMVASATRNGVRLVVALLDTPDRVGESTALLDWAFSTFRWSADAPLTTRSTARD